MAFEGMDPVVVTALAGQLGRHAETLGGVLTVVQTQVDRARTSWQGPAASAFEAGWNTTHRPSLVSAHDQLNAMSSLLTAQVSAQDTASGDSGGPGGLNTGPLGPLSGTTPPLGHGAPVAPPHSPDPDAPTALGALGGVLTATTVGPTVLQAAALQSLNDEIATFSTATSLSAADLASLQQTLAQAVAAGEVDTEVASTLLMHATERANEPLQPLFEAVQKAGESSNAGGLDEFITKPGAVEAAGSGLAAVGLLGDLLTIRDPKSSDLDTGLSYGNAAGTFTGTVYPTVRSHLDGSGDGEAVDGAETAGTDAAEEAATEAAVDAGLLEVNAAVDWIPVAGQAVAVGTGGLLVGELAGKTIWTGLNDGLDGLVHLP